MKQKVLLTFGSLLALVSVVWAEDYVCEDTVLTGKFRRYLPSVSATQVVLGTNEACTVVSKAETPAQQAINLGNPNAVPPVPPTVPVRYRKVVSGLVVEMDAAEKQVVDNTQAAQEALSQQYKDELQTKDLCKENLLAHVTQFLNTREANKHAQVDASHAAFQAEINAMSAVNLTVAKDMFTKANVRMHALTHGVIDDAYILLNNVARCLLAARKIRG